MAKFGLEDSYPENILQNNVKLKKPGKEKCRIEQETCGGHNLNKIYQLQGAFLLLRNTARANAGRGEIVMIIFKHHLPAKKQERQ